MQQDKTFTGKFKEILLDEDFKTSSKRVIGVVGFVLLALTYCYNIFFEIMLEEYVYDGMWVIVASVFGFSALQSFMKKR